MVIGDGIQDDDMEETAVKEVHQETETIETDQTEDGEIDKDDKD